MRKITGHLLIIFLISFILGGSITQLILIHSALVETKTVLEEIIPPIVGIGRLPWNEAFQNSDLDERSFGKQYLGQSTPELMDFIYNFSYVSHIELDYYHDFFSTEFITDPWMYDYVGFNFHAVTGISGLKNPFLTEIINITEGRLFTEKELKGENSISPVVVHWLFAFLNELEIGDVFILENRAYTIPIDAIGVFGRMFSESNRVANRTQEFQIIGLFDFEGYDEWRMGRTGHSETLNRLMINRIFAPSYVIDYSNSFTAFHRNYWGNERTLGGGDYTGTLESWREANLTPSTGSDMIVLNNISYLPRLIADTYFLESDFLQIESNTEVTDFYLILVQRERIIFYGLIVIGLMLASFLFGAAKKLAQQNKFLGIGITIFGLAISHFLAYALSPIALNFVYEIPSIEFDSSNASWTANTIDFFLDRRLTYEYVEQYFQVSLNGRTLQGLAILIGSILLMLLLAHMSTFKKNNKLAKGA